MYWDICTPDGHSLHDGLYLVCLRPLSLVEASPSGAKWCHDRGTVSLPKEVVQCPSPRRCHDHDRAPPQGGVMIMIVPLPKEV